MNVTETPEQGARLESLIDALNLTQTAIAETLGISQSYVSQLAGGSRNISRRVLHFITKNYPEVNINWLLTGNGQMFLEKKEPEAGVLTGVMEPEPVYARARRIAVDELAGIIEALEKRVEELERWRSEMDKK